MNTNKILNPSNIRCGMSNTNTTLKNSTKDTSSVSPNRLHHKMKETEKPIISNINVEIENNIVDIM